MASQGSSTDFHRGPQIRVQMELTPEQHAAMQEWSASVPTLYFLDICVVNIAKMSIAALDRDVRKSAIANRLRNLDRPQNSFSYLLALIEKTSDPLGTMSDAELERQVLNDVTALRGFFKRARVIESDEFLSGYLRELRRNPHERSRQAYVEFLEAANGRLSLADPVAPALRLGKSEEILNAADALSVARQHPVVLLTLSCLYGNPSAKKLMKFKADPHAFNAQNALADILVISRFAPLKLEIEHHGRAGTGPFARSAFITDDDGLSAILRCFEFQAVNSEVKGDKHETRITVTVNLECLLTDLKIGDHTAPQSTIANPDLGTNEFQQLCDMLTQPVPATPSA